ncbi:MAG: hypothetical protein GVY31_04515, partial [Alphaproteobacteria bacterium]|nr:hypothetical protein [Alphaproteobacteria bacterium]
MSLLKKLFGGSGDPPKEPRVEDYNGYRIYPAPLKEQGGYRIAARIEKDIGGETRTHTLIRADVVAD